MTASDRDAVLELLAQSLGRDADPRFEQLFAWKHEENAFGPSPAWVAVDGDRIAGLPGAHALGVRRRAGTVKAVRAVDTATHPDYQGQGIFTRLTLHGARGAARPTWTSSSTPRTTRAGPAT